MARKAGGRVPLPLAHFVCRCYSTGPNRRRGSPHIPLWRLQGSAGRACCWARALPDACHHGWHSRCALKHVPTHAMPTASQVTNSHPNSSSGDMQLEPISVDAPSQLLSRGSPLSPATRISQLSISEAGFRLDSSNGGMRDGLGSPLARRSSVTSIASGEGSFVASSHDGCSTATPSLAPTPNPETGEAPPPISGRALNASAAGSRRESVASVSSVASTARTVDTELQPTVPLRFEGAPTAERIGKDPTMCPGVTPPTAPLPAEMAELVTDLDGGDSDGDGTTAVFDGGMTSADEVRMGEEEEESADQVAAALEKHDDLLAHFSADEIFALCASRAMEAHEAMTMPPLGFDAALEHAPATTGDRDMFEGEEEGEEEESPEDAIASLLLDSTYEAASLPSSPRLGPVRSRLGAMGANSLSLPSSPLCKRPSSKSSSSTKRRKSSDASADERSGSTQMRRPTASTAKRASVPNSWRLLDEASGGEEELRPSDGGEGDGGTSSRKNKLQRCSACGARFLAAFMAAGPSLSSPPAPRPPRQPLSPRPQTTMLLEGFRVTSLVPCVSLWLVAPPPLPTQVCLGTSRARVLRWGRQISSRHRPSRHAQLVHPSRPSRRTLRHSSRALVRKSRQIPPRPVETRAARLHKTKSPTSRAHPMLPMNPRASRRVVLRVALHAALHARVPLLLVVGSQRGSASSASWLWPSMQ